MGKKNHAPLAVLFGIVVLSCGAAKPDEAVLLLYTKAFAVYSGGGYADAAAMLSAAKDFPPALVLRGKALFLAGNDDDAEAALRRALSLNPENIEAGIFLCRVLREKQSYGEAETIVEKILANDPGNIRALRLAAELALDVDSRGEARAIAFLDRAVESSAELALVFLDRARSRWIGGSAEAALEDLSRAKALLPRGSPMTRSILSLEKTITGQEAEL